MFLEIKGLFYFFDAVCANRLVNRELNTLIPTKNEKNHTNIWTYHIISSVTEVNLGLFHNY